MENGRNRFKKEFKKRVYAWTLDLIAFTEELPRDRVRNVMGRQLLRSGTSVLANYVEADSASSKKDFVNFFTYSLKSANESKVWLSLLKDAGKGNPARIDPLLRELMKYQTSSHLV